MTEDDTPWDDAQSARIAELEAEIAARDELSSMLSQQIAVLEEANAVLVDSMAEFEYERLSRDWEHLPCVTDGLYAPYPGIGALVPPIDPQVKGALDRMAARMTEGYPFQVNGVSKISYVDGELRQVGVDWRDIYADTQAPAPYAEPAVYKLADDSLLLPQPSSAAQGTASPNSVFYGVDLSPLVDWSIPSDPTSFDPPPSPTAPALPSRALSPDAAPLGLRVPRGF